MKLKGMLLTMVAAAAFSAPSAMAAEKIKIGRRGVRPEGRVYANLVRGAEGGILRSRKATSK